MAASSDLRPSPHDRITVAWFGAEAPARQVAACGDLDVHVRRDDGDLARVLREVRPHVLVSCGDVGSFPRLHALPLHERARWIHESDPAADPEAVAARIVHTFVLNATTRRFPQRPLVTVFTAAFRPGEAIERPLRSLLAQTYDDWEWVICDDSPDGGRTFAALSSLAERDARIAVHRADRPSGIIGEVKRRACMLGRGEILVELDHDDELTADALASVVAAFAAHPDAGFVYSDWSEVFTDGRPATYPPGWAFGYGRYREERHGDRTWVVAEAPEVNAKTIRHIVSAPNHLRAWRRDAYLAAGGHAPDVHVADDFELCLRTFLTTRMIHLRRFGYVQWLDPEGGNAQRRRNREIQRLVAHFRARYHEAIHHRLLELGVDDFLWKDGRLDWEAPAPQPTPFANYVFE